MLTDLLKVIVLVAGAAGLGGGAAAAEQEAWHVKDAEIRIPVTVSVEEVLARMPPQVYLADLNPVEAKGIVFDRKTKLALKAKGSVTFSLKPEYAWLSLRNRANVFVDDQKMAPLPDGEDRVFALPRGGKQLRIEAEANFVGQAGFITRGPIVSRADLCLPGLDPTALVPLVHRMSGEQVGCRVLWAHPSEPMQIVFDCSSGETQYHVYLVDRSKRPPRLDWTPKAGLIFESRYLDSSDTTIIKTPEDFRKLWDGADFIAEKSAKDAVYVGYFPGRPMCGDKPNYFDTPKGAPLALSRYSGFFHIPETQEYMFLFSAWPGGYLLFDDKLVAETMSNSCWKRYTEGKGERAKKFQVKLTKGLHKLEFCQFGRDGRFYSQLGWWPHGIVPMNGRWGIWSSNPGGNGDGFSTFGFDYQFSVWEPLAVAAAAPAVRRGRDVFASFTWSYTKLEHGRRDGSHWLGRYPAGDVVGLSFTGMLSQERANAVFRWRFDDGHTAETQTVDHVFFSPGTRKVELEVLDGPGGKEIARAAGNIHVHIDWAAPYDGAKNLELEPILERRAKEFATVTPIKEVVSLYYWSLREHWYPSKDGKPPTARNWPELKATIGAALTARVDEIIKELPYTRLLDLAQLMAAPDEARYDVADKLCKGVMDRAPAGGRDWKSAAAIMADILVCVRGKPQDGLQLLAMAETTAANPDLTAGWRTAKAKRWYSNISESAVGGATEDLQWMNDCSITGCFDGHIRPQTTELGEGVWFEKELELPASRQGKELAVYFGAMPDNRMLWFNGKRLAEPESDGNIVIPAELQRYGGKNKILVLFQPIASPDSYPQDFRPFYNITKPTAARLVGVPMELYTSADCTEKGVNYAYYETVKDKKKIPRGWVKGKLMMDEVKLESIFATPGPVKKGTLKQVDLSPRERDDFFGMVFTGYIKAGAGIHRFDEHEYIENRLNPNYYKSLSLISVGDARMWIDSKAIDMGELKGKFVPGVTNLVSHGKMYLGEGVHPFTLIYFNEGANTFLKFTPPETWVPETEILAGCVKAAALVMTGEGGMAQEVLLALRPDAWPLGEEKQIQLTSDLRKIPKWVREDGTDAALKVIDSWLVKHPMLQTVPVFMLAKMETVVAVGDDTRACTLGEQIGRMDLNQTQREQWMLMQVKAALKAGKMDAARDVYVKLKETAPYSQATIEAREAITKTVRGK